MKIRVSKLTDMKNWNCNEAIGSYNQMYAAALLSRQLQDEESNCLEQIVHVLIKKWDLMNHSRKFDI